MRTILPLLSVKTVKIWPPQRLATDLIDRGTTDTHHHPITPGNELQGRHIAAKPEPLLQRLDDLIGPVTDPLIVKTLPDNLGIEDGTDRVGVASANRTQVVK